MTLVPELLGELGDGRRLAGSVHAANQDDLRREAGSERKRLRHRFENRGDLVGERGQDVCGCDPFVEPVAREARGEAARGLDTYVGEDQEVFEVRQRVRVETAGREKIVDSVDEPARSALEPGPQARHPSEVGVRGEAHAAVSATRTPSVTPMIVASTMVPGGAGALRRAGA